MTIYKPSPNLPPTTPHVEEVNWLPRTYLAEWFLIQTILTRWTSASNGLWDPISSLQYAPDAISENQAPSITGVNFQAFSFEIENLQGAREENPSLIVLNLILKKCRKLGDIVGMRMLRQDDIDP